MTNLVSLGFISFIFILSGCSVLRTITGSDIDPDRFDKARQARMLEVRQQAALHLAERLISGDPVDNGDVTLYINQEGVGKFVQQYIGTNGWIDSHTRYIIRNATVQLFNGSAIMSLDLFVHSDKYSTDVELVMDCILSFRIVNDELEALVEPFNISPKVTAEGVLSHFEDILADIIKVRLARLSKDIPPIRFPIDYSSSIPMESVNTSIRTKVNMSIQSPRRLINSRFILKEVLVFNRCIVISMDINKLSVK